MFLLWCNVFVFEKIGVLVTLTFAIVATAVLSDLWSGEWSTLLLSFQVGQLHGLVTSLHLKNFMSSLNKSNNNNKINNQTNYNQINNQTYCQFCLFCHDEWLYSWIMDQAGGARAAGPWAGGGVRG